MGVWIAIRNTTLAMLVDADDVAVVASRTWYLHRQGYARSLDIKLGAVYAHRLILSAVRGQHVDHRNRDNLDNRRANLRLCSRSENMANRKMHKNNKSGFKGVHLNRKSGKWLVLIRQHKRLTRVGLFACKIEAAKAYDARARVMFGEFARLNFPEVA